MAGTSQSPVAIGELVATHGLKGWLKLKPYNPSTTILSSVDKILLHKNNAAAAYLFQWNGRLKGHFLIKLDGLDSIDAAHSWLGAIVSVDERDLQPLSAGEYYYHQVLGFDVYDTSGHWIGKVRRLWSNPGCDLYVVAGTAKEYLIPAVKEIIERVDLAENKMVVNPPAGLLDL